MSMDGNDYQEGYEEGVSSQLEEVSKLEKLLSESERRESSLQAEIESLKAKLSVQDWHDASELPTEEGRYEIYEINGDDIKIKYLEASKLYINYLLSNAGGYFPHEIYWRKITLPEGK
jgi:predicted RNase H-like nuclease (RuvC/YqgF family)